MQSHPVSLGWVFPAGNLHVSVIRGPCWVWWKNGIFTSYPRLRVFLHVFCKTPGDKPIYLVLSSGNLGIQTWQTGSASKSLRSTEGTECCRWGTPRGINTGNNRNQKPLVTNRNSKLCLWLWRKASWVWRLVPCCQLCEFVQDTSNGACPMEEPTACWS